MRLDSAELRWNLALPVILSSVSHVTRLFRDLRWNRCMHFVGRALTRTDAGELRGPERWSAVSQGQGTESACPWLLSSPLSLMTSERVLDFSSFQRRHMPCSAFSSVTMTLARRSCRCISLISFRYGQNYEIVSSAENTLEVENSETNNCILKWLHWNIGNANTFSLPNS